MPTKQERDDFLADSDLEEDEELKDTVSKNIGLNTFNKKSALKRSKTMVQPVKNSELKFDVMDDPDYPSEAVNSNIIVEQIEVNGCVQKIIKKTYYMIDGTTKTITRMEQA